MTIFRIFRVVEKVARRYISRHGESPLAILESHAQLFVQLSASRGQMGKDPALETKGLRLSTDWSGF